MKRIFIYCSILLNICLLISIGIQLLPQFIQHVSTSLNDKNVSKRIAILTPTTHPSLEKIEHGFSKKLIKNSANAYEIKVFNAQGNRMLMHSQAEEIAAHNYDLIFTIGTGTSVMIKEILTKRGKSTPHIFAAIDDPIGLGIVASLDCPGGNATGVIEIPSYKEQIALLKMIKPVSTILLVYAPHEGGGMTKDKIELEKILKHNNITLKIVEIINTHEIYAKVSGMISECDVVMVFKDNTVVSGLDALIKLCNLHHKTLLTTDLDSGDRGAALSYGVHEDQFGVKAAYLARAILEEHKNIGTLACLTPGMHKFKINLRTAEQQGIILSDEQKVLFSLIETV